MKSLLYTFTLMTFLSMALIAPLSASAQVMATMPTLYNQNGVAVNVNNTSPLPAGYYYLQPSALASSQVYYYGNGTYYDESTHLFGGSINNSNGVAGVPLGYAVVTSTIVSSPGVPSTGVGGNAVTLWSIVIASVAVLVSGGAYLMNRRSIPVIS